MNRIELRMQDWAAAVFELNGRKAKWGDLKEEANSYACTIGGSTSPVEGESQEAWDARVDALVDADPHWHELVAPSEAFWSTQVEPALEVEGLAYKALVEALVQDAGMTEQQAGVILSLAEKLGGRWATGLRLSTLRAPEIITKKQAEMVARSLMDLLEAA